MYKFFNTSGPCFPDKHYMIPTSERWFQTQELIEQEKYFVLRAPKQTGKTTQVLSLVNQLNADGNYIALYINVEPAQAYRENAEKVNEVILSRFRIQSLVDLPEELRPSSACYDVASMLEGMGEFLTKWCLELPKPLVLFIDKVDTLMGDSLLSVLRQIRAGYTNRPHAFPHSVCLIGVRNIRDYRIFSDREQRYVIGGSAFNIKDESLTIQDFTQEQVVQLYEQHTQATGQPFSQAALEKVFWYSQGQPWLVNAFGKQLCFSSQKIPIEQTVEPHHVDGASEQLIARRDGHLDQLGDKLTEPRVERIIQEILLGEREEKAPKVSQDDQQYLLDLGLIRKGLHGFEIANPIYREIIPRELTSYDQETLGQNPLWYIYPNGKLNINKLLEAYIAFYKEHSEMVTARKTYTEAAHHLLFLAWLQRVVNGAGPAHRGRIHREYAAGLGRMDLMIEFAGEKFAFELKLWSKTALTKGRKQLADYLKRCGLDFGRLIIYSRKPPDDMETVGKREQCEVAGKQIADYPVLRTC